jgi:hypothetical protein
MASSLSYTPAVSTGNAAGLCAISLVLLVPLALLAFADGPDAAKTGGFGEPTCLECHDDNGLNDASGRMSLSGIPEMYTPGKDYTITVTLARAGLARAGFQLAARFDQGSSAGMGAGALHTSDNRTQLLEGGDKRVTYIEQTLTGSKVDPAGTAEWQFGWTAPTTGGSVLFHASANASNDDRSALGDFIYTAVAHSVEGH